MTKTLTALFTRDGNGFTALCPEVDVASQGDTVEEAKKNLTEAVQLFFECADASEIDQRLSGESFISSLEVQLAWPAGFVRAGSMPDPGGSRIRKCEAARESCHHAETYGGDDDHGASPPASGGADRNAALHHPAEWSIRG